MEIANMLNITDRAVSKWERGLSLPDSGIMLQLCTILGITVNELLTGSEIYADNDKESPKLALRIKKCFIHNYLMELISVYSYFHAICKCSRIDLGCHRQINDFQFRTVYESFFPNYLQSLRECNCF